MILSQLLPFTVGTSHMYRVRLGYITVWMMNSRVVCSDSDNGVVPRERWVPACVCQFLRQINCSFRQGRSDSTSNCLPPWATTTVVACKPPYQIITLLGFLVYFTEIAMILDSYHICFLLKKRIKKERNRNVKNVRQKHYLVELNSWQGSVVS